MLGITKPELPKDAQIVNEALADALRNAKGYQVFRKIQEEIMVGETIREMRDLTVSQLDQIEGLRLRSDSYIRLKLYDNDYWHHYLKAVGSFERAILRFAPW